MRDVFTSPESARVGLYCTILKDAGFNVFVRNDNVSSAEVVAPLFYPAVCIMDDDRYDEAVALLAKHLNAPVVFSADWTCPQCKEVVPGSFDSCWNCETMKPEALIA